MVKVAFEGFRRKQGRSAESRSLFIWRSRAEIGDSRKRDSERETGDDDRFREDHAVKLSETTDLSKRMEIDGCRTEK